MKGRMDSDLRFAVPRFAVRGKGQTRSFFVPVFHQAQQESTAMVSVSSICIAEGKRVRIYLDQSEMDDRNAHQLAEEIIAQMESIVMPRLCAVLGKPADIDGDGYLSILLTSKFSPQRSLIDADDGSSLMKGFVRPCDFQQSSNQSGTGYSNHCDMIYLSSQLSRVKGLHLRSLLAHEFAHVLCLSQKKGLEEDWLSEAIGHVSERLGGGDESNLKARKAVFYASPESVPVCIENYAIAGLWRDPGCRGGAALFLQHCIDCFGSDFLFQLPQSETYGRENLEQATGVRFETLFQNWNLELADDAGRDRIEWKRISRGSKTYRLAGTSSLYLSVSKRSALANGTPLRIRIRASPGAKIKVACRKKKD